MSNLFLGIDIGTSGCKLALYDAKGLLHGSASESYGAYYPAPGHVEQDANDWWQAVCTGLRRLWEDGASPASIAAIGVDGQSWSAIPIDAAGNVLANTPIWMDTRAEDICRLWRGRLSEQSIFDISCNPFAPTYTLPKVLYWMERDPALITAASHILQSNAFIVFRLTNAISMDYSMSYGWHNFSQRELKYDKGLTKAFQIPPRFLIDPVPSHQIVGMVTHEAARLTGLLQGTPVVAGGLDAACGTLGAGVLEDGQTQEQGGQAGGMSICQSSPICHPKLILSPHVAPNKWLLQGGTVGGGASLKWFADQLASQGLPPGDGVFDRLSGQAASSPPGANGLLFLPYLAGERSPLWDAKAQGMYFGINYATTYGDFVRAIMEGVAFALRHNIDTAREAGAAITHLHATGGSANSLLWAQIKADITGRSMLIPASDTATTCGAAMLAMVGSGCYPTFRDAVKSIVKIRRVFKPNACLFPAYTALYEVYKGLYQNTAANMEALFEIKQTILKE